MTVILKVVAIKAVIAQLTEPTEDFLNKIYIEKIVYPYEVVNLKKKLK